MSMSASPLDDPRVLVCGSRHWPWPDAVGAVLDRLAARHPDLVVIEGAATGADWAAHRWCLRHELPESRHRCHPVDWSAVRRARPGDWKAAGPERNARMLDERPRLVVAFHDRFDPDSGGTSDMALRAALAGVPVWHVPGADPRVGRWLTVGMFPRRRVVRLGSSVGRGRREGRDPA